MTESRGSGTILVGLSVLIQRRFAQICADHDLTPSQAQLLCVADGESCGMTEIAGRMGLAKNGLSGLVDRAERRGLIRRETPGPDRRSVTLVVTPLGRKTVRALYADVNDRLPDTLDDLSPIDRALADQLLTAISALPGIPLPAS